MSWLTGNIINVVWDDEANGWVFAVWKRPWWQRMQARWYGLLNWFAWRVLKWECECAWTVPYGFVPEADCSQHDRID